jgi:hypothetical protein
LFSPLGNELVDKTDVFRNGFILGLHAAAAVPTAPLLGRNTARNDSLELIAAEGEWRAND